MGSVSSCPRPEIFASPEGSVVKYAHISGNQDFSLTFKACDIGNNYQLNN